MYLDVDWFGFLRTLDSELHRNKQKAPEPLTVSGQHGDADPGVAQLDEGQAAHLAVPLADKQHVLGTHVPVYQVLVLLLDRTVNGKLDKCLIRSYIRNGTTMEPTIIQNFDTITEVLALFLTSE